MFLYKIKLYSRSYNAKYLKKAPQKLPQTDSQKRTPQNGHSKKRIPQKLIQNPNNPNPNYDYPTFGGGGGIYKEWSDSLEIYNTQILNNTAANGAGGGIAIYLSNDIIIDNRYKIDTKAI